MHSSGLLSTQFNVLHVIYKSDSIRISDLAARLEMGRTTLTRNLAILEREGKDHRTRNLTATQKGHRAVTRAIPLWNEVQDKVKQKMGETLSCFKLLANLSPNTENVVGTNSHAVALLNTKKEIGRRYMIIIHERNDNIIFY